MLPQASITHHIAGRTRFRILSQRLDRAYFERLEKALLGLDGIDDVRVNAITGSALLLHRLEAAEIAEHAASEGLFELRAVEKPAVLSEQLALKLGRRWQSADGWLRDASSGQVDLVGFTAIGLAAAAALQAVRGRALPAGVTLINYAIGLIKGRG